MNGRDERGPWYLLTGLVLGVVAGLIYSWAVRPVEYVNTVPASLRGDFKEQYRALIAVAYIGNGDLERARARLELLQDGDMFRALTEQAQRTLAKNGPDREAQALGMLAIALGQPPPGPGQVVTQPGPRPTQPPDTPNPTNSPPLTSPAVPTMRATLPATSLPLSLSATPVLSASPEALATEAPASAATPTIANVASSPTPIATPADAFILLSQEKICEPGLSSPVFQIEALDRFNRPVPGAVVIVRWPDGEERFTTGLKPDKGAGYADFNPAPGVLYSLRVGEKGTPVENLAAGMCPGSSGAPVWGALLLKFISP